jgi:hypothetical protein
MAFCWQNFGGFCLWAACVWIFNSMNCLDEKPGFQGGFFGGFGAFTKLSDFGLDLLGVKVVRYMYNH